MKINLILTICAALLTFGCNSHLHLRSSEKDLDKESLENETAISKDSITEFGLPKIFNCKYLIDTIQPIDFPRIGNILYESGMKKCIIKEASFGNEDCQSQLIFLIQMERKHNPTYLHLGHQKYRGKKVFTELLKVAEKFECFHEEYQTSYFSYHYNKLLDMINSIDGLESYEYTDKRAKELLTNEQIEEVLAKNTDCNKKQNELLHRILSEALEEDKIEFKSYLPKEK